MADVGSWKPTGRIEPAALGQSELSQGYYRFLHGLDPIATWEEVKPLPEPIETEATYDLDQDVLGQLYSICPPLVAAVHESANFDAAARLLGLRYAWSRIHMHAGLLDAMDGWLDDAGLPTAMVEPGCFCSGLVHYLPTVWNRPYLGIDISPVALDVCRALEKQHGMAGERKLFRADFTQISGDRLAELVGTPLDGSALILCNLLNGLCGYWDTYPAIHPWTVNAWMVSYWVNAGMTVFVCERTDDPEATVKFIVENGRWDPGAQALILSEFDTIATVRMNPENPLGTWEEARCCVAVFYRP